MPGNPHECRVNAAQCSKLAQNAITSECDAFVALAKTWKKLAAELEADQMLLQALSELHLTSQPYEALLLCFEYSPRSELAFAKEAKDALASCQQEP